MKKLLKTLACAFALFTAAFAAADWQSNLTDALKAAKASDKPVLILFTGSDWCPPCMHMERTVFPENAFASYAKKHLILVKLEFLRRTQQTAATKAANEAAAEKYDIRGFPTLVLVDADGKELSRTVGGTDIESLMAWLTSAVKKAPSPKPAKA